MVRRCWFEGESQVRRLGVLGQGVAWRIGVGVRPGGLRDRELRDIATPGASEAPQLRRPDS